MNSYILGIGGILFRSNNPEETRNWYKTHFGLESEKWGAYFQWRMQDNAEKSAGTTWCAFKNDTDYFGESGQEFMVNYIVRDMDELLQNLAKQGIGQVKPAENTDFGKFAWVNDSDGRRIELWEPAAES
ncbi:MAG: VOC family protein [Bacteroidetes bacterium]|nr:VOC family protein [Bacteroidota bacterium]